VQTGLKTIAACQSPSLVRRGRGCKAQKWCNLAIEAVRMWRIGRFLDSSGREPFETADRLCACPKTQPIRSRGNLPRFPAL